MFVNSCVMMYGLSLLRLCVYSCVYVRYIWCVCELLCDLVLFVYVVSLSVCVFVCFCLC